MNTREYSSDMIFPSSGAGMIPFSICVTLQVRRRVFMVGCKRDVCEAGGRR